ncbi:predicted protein [Pyrenophora tritici-repentis Pt-1C-BFP]|uniref:Uncharacterized protein n=1 Tax=Pyrenophora tritici-repentis (strain Pt-1C-BFP) TaxID=426418 RepID=B2WPU8_PYRTR|nr:uncharacterized protein PTRG_12008 [Pyrenophora tritici-repentis Pt-1C-BFP]EDU46164.1 predicted protein [Pyrenophora tritici-repentis Pt-1C-BFP]
MIKLQDVANVMEESLSQRPPVKTLWQGGMVLGNNASIVALWSLKIRNLRLN